MYYYEATEFHSRINLTRKEAMKQIKAFGKNVIMKLIKEKEKEQAPNKIIIQETNKKPLKFYEVIDSNNEKIKPGNTVYLNGFCHAVEIDGNEYHICQEDAISAILQ